MIQAWKLAVPFELIRYAGANHLCVKIEYQGKIYVIEPYDLKKTINGSIILLAIDHNTNQIVFFNIHDIQKIEMIKISFNPRYLIALTPFSFSK